MSRRGAIGAAVAAALGLAGAGTGWARPKAPPPPESAEPGAPLAAPRKVRPDAWVEGSRYHDGAGPERVQVTVAHAALIARPNPDGQVVGGAKRGEILSVVRTSRDELWYLVELGAGEIAWVSAAQVKPLGDESPAGSAPRRARPPAPPPAPPPEDTPAPREAPPEPAGPAPGEPQGAPEELAPGELAPVRGTPAASPQRFLVLARGGVALLGQRFTANAGGFLTNYEASATGLAVDLELAVRFPIGRTFRLGLDGGYRFAGATGVRVSPPGAGAAGSFVLGLAVHDADAAGSVGVRFAALGGTELALRVGAALRAEILQQDLRAPLPSDRAITGLFGLRVFAPSLIGGAAGSLGAGLDLALLAPGSFVETGGLGEGAPDSPLGFVAGLRVAFRFTAGVGIEAGLRYAALHASLHGPADRNPAITAADRSSSSLHITLGLSFSR